MDQHKRGKMNQVTVGILLLAVVGLIVIMIQVMVYQKYHKGGYTSNKEDR
jgi:tetrahydromethanopterin S-methyltransferase subunit G